jgi:hypothetical protein
VLPVRARRHRDVPRTVGARRGWEQRVRRVHQRVNRMRALRGSMHVCMLMHATRAA